MSYFTSITPVLTGFNHDAMVQFSTYAQGKAFFDTRAKIGPREKERGGATSKEARGVERSGCSIILIKVRDRLMKKCHADVNFLFLQGDVGAAYSRGGAGQL